MPKRNDLSAYKSQPKQVLKAVPNPAPQPVEKGRGPKPKPMAEKRSEKVLLSLTPGERAKLEEQAGLVPLATWIVHHLRSAGALD